VDDEVLNVGLNNFSENAQQDRNQAADGTHSHTLETIPLIMLILIMIKPFYRSHPV
jgi:hypothetical protein